ncbi:MAG: hypothetical protein WA802_08945 [Terracidiphilus sp.]
MKVVRAHFSRLPFFALSLLAAQAGIGWAAQPAADNASSTCSTSEPASYPRAAISNGIVNAVLYLPDANTGYYRGKRFDWSGVVGCLTYKGHSYFGVWFPHYDPLQNDAITGPVEEFRSSDGNGTQGYDQAKPGEPFVKIGVGVLRKVDDTPYKFVTRYEMIDGGKWTVHTNPRGASFKQDLKSPVGIAYAYKKTLSLDKQNPVLIIEHELKNTGTVNIDTQVYDHDFYMLDGVPTGPETVIRFPFEPRPENDLGYGARVEGKQIVFDRELQVMQFASSYIGGFSSDPSSYDIVVENPKTGVGVEQTGDQPISRFNFWSMRTTVCPEAYVHLKIAPGQTAHWTIRYRFFAK